MPQPFKRKKNQKINLTPAAVVRVPWAALDIASIASHWSKLEFSMGIMYTYLLHGKDKAAFEFYHDLIDMSLREKAFMTAARGQLTNELVEEVKSLYAEVRKRAKERNTVVHGNWAYVETKPNSIFLSNPKDISVQINKIFKFLTAAKKEPAKVPPKFSVDLSEGDYIEYKHSDFQAIVQRIIALDEKATVLGNKVLARALELLGSPDD